MPPGTSGSSPLAGVYSTNGSAPSTRALAEMVSVADMDTFAALMPVSAHTPFAGSALGVQV